MHQDLIITKTILYDPCNLSCSKFIAESESVAYGAYAFTINNYKIQFRVAKITPIKIGQFVTLWQRADTGTIQPYDAADAIDFFVISVRNNNTFGQFVFPKDILVAQNIFSTNGKGGKNGIRVYPPWDKTISKQAQKTQQWQLKYFLAMPINGAIDYARAKALYANIII